MGRSSWWRQHGAAIRPAVARFASRALPAGDPASEIDLPRVDQASEPDRNSFFVAGKGALLRRHPGDFILSDHAGDDRLQEDLAESHESRVTKSLHPVVCAGRAWLHPAALPNGPRWLRLQIVHDNAKEVFDCKALFDGCCCSGVLQVCCGF